MIHGFYTVQEFHTACTVVLKEAKDPYAKSYANAGLTLTTGEEIRCQCLYILNNLSTWRGETARNTKLIFKRLAKEKS